MFESFSRCHWPGIRTAYDDWSAEKESVCRVARLSRYCLGLACEREVRSEEKEGRGV